MPKQSIFIKIYLCFWLATLLIVAAQIGFDRLTKSHAPMDDRMRDALTPLVTEYGHRALEYRVAGDDASLEKATEQLKRSTGIDAYLIDRTNHEVSNRALPEEVRAVGLQARQTGKARFSFSRQRVLLALPMNDRDGNSYSVIGDLPFAAHDPGHLPPPGPPPPGPFVNFLFLPFGKGPIPPPFLLGPGPPPHPNNTLFLFRLLITLFISGGVCYWLARYLTAPVVKLRDATRRFAGGELAVRIGPGNGKWKDELSELSQDFDLMAEQISTLLTRQRQLIRDISHELRSPLTRLTIAVELLRRQSSAEAMPALDRIEKEAVLLNDMIGQTLAISRLESSIGTIETDPVDIARLLEMIAEDADFEANARQCKVQILESTACALWGTEEWLRRAIENVVRNAVRYTHAGTTVDLRLSQIMLDSRPYAEISIRDHGSGVPETSLPHLFQPFYRVSNARERQTGGTGLGLAITERAVLLHHGSIEASNASGGGLVVTIRLPLASGRSEQGH
jgi:signal transduction histidine kinase